MKESERRALEALRFNWAPTQEAVWSALQGHVDGLDGGAGRAVMAAFDDIAREPSGRPLGVVVEGQHGAGKTHLLCWVREQVQEHGGYFFVMGLPQGKGFWTNVVHSYLAGLRRYGFCDQAQLHVFLGRLCERLGVAQGVADEVTGRALLTRDGLNALTKAARETLPDVVDRRCSYALKALVLVGGHDHTASDAGEAYLMSEVDCAKEDLARWGIPAVVSTPRDIASQISLLLGVTGSTVLAVDQIDTLFAQAQTPAIQFGDAEVHGHQDPEKLRVADELGSGLMDLREALHKTVPVVACLPASWNLIKTKSIDSVPDRFRKETRLHRIPTPTLAVRLVEARFGPKFSSLGFAPRYATWPVAAPAFDEAPRYTPRSLLKRIDRHIKWCLRRGVVTELVSLDEDESVDHSPPVEIPAEALVRLDARFRELVKAADVSGALNPDIEDSEMPKLLEAGLHAWVEEQGERRDTYEVLRGQGWNPTVHAMLMEILDEEIEDEIHWSFRSLSRTHHNAVITRLNRLQDFAALDRNVPKRKAILIRNSPWPTGPVTTRRRKEFLDLGGVAETISENDLQTFHALGNLLENKDEILSAWLASRRPAGNTTFFRKILGDPPLPGPTIGRTPHGGPAGSGSSDDDGAARPKSSGSLPKPKATAPAAEEPVLLGVDVDAGVEVEVPLESLRKHSVIFAGSGSGKTVLIRRLIEECALRGVSTIALDPNNDLARLGDAWPEPPDAWSPGDAKRASAYLAGTDVVVWTPRRESGRPLSLQPLPDFAAVIDDPDEFELALDTAVAALAPRARMGGSTAKMDRGKAVLREALFYYARHGGRRLTGFVALLADLPENVASLSKAADLAHEMAQTLTAAMINDPLFGGSGVPLDPGVLLTPPPGKRARISVISLIGLPSNEQRQSFVNQLQMALFAWIKQNPAGDRPLGGLFVMDEAQTLAPSGAMTACTESTLALASQARKYGLGLIFATQAPRGIHNRIVGNAATQFYGFLNSPVQISAAREMAQSKASDVLDISRLTAGQFYAVGEGMPFRKVATPMCLSYHPQTALTTEQVLERARS